MSQQNGEPIPTASPVPSSDAVKAGAPIAMPVGKRIGNGLVGWIAVVALVAGVVYLQNFVRPTIAAEKGAKAPALAGNPVMLELQAKTLIGLNELAAENKDAKKEERDAVEAQLLRQLDTLNRGSVPQRLRVIILVGEVGGPEKAKEALAKLNDRINERPDKVPGTEDIDIISRLYGDLADGRPDTPTVAPDERIALRAKYGWFGDLAVGNRDAPDEDSKRIRVVALESADRAARAVYALLLVIPAAFVIGLVTLAVLSIVYLRRLGTERPMTTGLGPAVPHHRVYVETFAIWMAGYLILSVVARLPPISVYVHELLAQCGAMFLSLTALAWPVLRGVRWKQIRRDIGWTAGPLPLLEPTIGVLTYCMAIPMACIGFAITFGLLFLQATGRLNLGGAPGPVLPGLGGAEPADPFASDPSITHPVIELFANASNFELGAILVLAGVAAPIVEETMFRGVLYRHVRDGTRVLGLFSVVASALLVNVIFGLVHPQGFFVVPALAALACGFVVAREWRGTLIPSIIAHGINNSLLLVAVMEMTR